jgi:hypothetical protein
MEPPPLPREGCVWLSFGEESQLDAFHLEIPMKIQGGSVFFSRASGLRVDFFYLRVALGPPHLPYLTKIGSNYCINSLKMTSGLKEVATQH